MASNRFQTVDVVIANGASLSGELALNGAHLVGIVMPAAWDAAAITFAGASASGGTFQPIYDANGEVTLPSTSVAASRSLSVAAGAFGGWPAIKIRSGTNGAAVNQTAARTLTCILMTYN